MNITQLAVKNFQGLRHADIEITEPLLLVSGGNAAGKTSLLDAISMAFTGHPRRVKLKKDMGQLITKGNKKARVSVTTTEGQFATELPDTKAALHFGEHSFLQFALDSTAFAKLGDKERRKLLFEVTGAGAKMPVILEKLAALGISDVMVEQIKPLLISGFPAASDHAKSLASEARGAWKQITGETYGSAKADGWEPAVSATSIDPALLANAKSALDKLQVELAEVQETFGANKSASEQAERVAVRIAELEVLVSKLGERQNKANRDAADLAHWKEQLEIAKQAGSGPKQGLIHDMARFLESLRHNDNIDLGIAGCKQAKDIIDKYISEHGDFEEDGNPELSARVPEFTELVKTLTATLKASEAALNESLDASASVEELKKSPLKVIEKEALKNAENYITKLRQDRDAAAAEVTNLSVAEGSAGSRAKAISEAARQHELVEAYCQLAEALSPTGIPADILQGALKPVNELLTTIAASSGWAAVQINDDIDIVYGERLYGLLSESEQWRADSMLSVALASLSGLGFVVLDRFDVLETSSRPQAIKLMLKCIKDSTIDQAIMAGTMKEPMKRVLPGMQAVWISDGAILDGKGGSNE